MPQDIALPTTSNSIAPLRNVAAFTELVDRVMNRTRGLPGMATFHGFSGYGKSYAALYAANKHRAYLVQMKSAWTRKKLLQVILQEMGIMPAGTIPDMLDQVGEQLSLSGRPLIVDEADVLVTKGMIEIIRDIYESSQAAIILVGEEKLPTMLKRWERVHGRMLDWVPALPAVLNDARHLAHLYCRGISVADDLLIPLHEAAQGSIRRICVSLDRVREAAETAGLDKVSRAEYRGEFFTGAAPATRRAV